MSIVLHDVQAFARWGRSELIPPEVIAASQEPGPALYARFGCFPLPDRKAQDECHQATQTVRSTFAEYGISTHVLEGFLELGPKKYLQHAVALLQLPQWWITVDAAASQLPAYSDAEVLFVISAPNWDALSHALFEAYKWWSPA